MAVWETEDESSAPAVASLPTPNDTPYRTPSRGSKKSRRSITPPAAKSSPPPMTTSDKSDKASNRTSRDITTDDSISILDPRRFTPTLHANLVSEILALRRDQEEKLKIIESLETSLHTTREEHDVLQTTLATTSKESRSLKRQLALLEGGTSSALGELARERDEAVDSGTETKKRVDALQKKVRSQEDESQRVHDQWAREKDAWSEEKRKFERKVHVAESRLKVVLEEVAAYQAAQQQAQESEVEERENDNASIRTMSMTNSIRFSAMNGHGSMKPMNGNSLADELNMDADEDWQTDHDGRESVLSSHFHARNASRDSNFSRTHFRNQSVESLVRPGSVARGKLYANHSVLERLEGGIQEDDETQGTITPKATYVDTGVQYSPPPSPRLPASKAVSPEPPILVARAERLQSVESPPREWEVEANQRKKRVHISRPPPIESPALPRLMVSSSSQTMEPEPLSPPKTPRSPLTPKSPTRPPPPPPPLVVQQPPKPASVDSCTQTDRPATPPPRPPPVPSTLPPIPSISIIPPTSRPTTPREPRLPQLFKDVGCQAMIQAPPSYTTTSVQTEEIRIDQRLNLLPPHLHPSTICSRPHSPDPPPALPTESPAADENRQFTPLPGNLPPRNPRRLMSKKSIGVDIPLSPRTSDIIETHDAYPGNNDDGPLSHQKAPMRRPHRISSLFAGFDGNSTDEADEFGDAEASDPEFRTALSAPSRPKSTANKPTKRSSNSTNTTSPEQPQSNRQSWSRSSMKFGGTELYAKFNLDRENQEGITKKPSLKSSRTMEKTVMGSNRASVMRKAAMIQSGIASHQGRARSPSLPDTRDPPFPIPTRASSRRPPISVSAPSDGQRSPTRAGGEAWHRRGIGRSHYRANSIRKVRSAAALPRNQRYRRQGSRSPPPFSPSIESPGSPSVPPLPNNDITTPRGRDISNGSRYRMHKPQNSTNTENTGDTGMNSVGSSAQATSVVDAIAQTMVGEWMFKYVRRRKSFGVPESAGRDDNSNDRHKRWVWLAPYERAILWSSKQPVSGSALMGKSGRKLTIQSVLDVKDDNPSPKGAPQLFNRSILILTPQRALKFTATSAERHYLWLTSLSFLAHSSQAVPEIVQQPKPLPEFEPPKPKVRKPGIRDSIRLAKGKNNMARPAPPSVNSSQAADLNVYQQPDPFIPPIPPPTHTRDPSYEVAEPPYIPRFHERTNQGAVHGRKRSNTGGHVPPPLSFRGFSGPAGSSGTHHTSTNSTAGASVGTAGSSDIYQSQPSQASTNGTMWAMSTGGSGRTSEASSRPGNFFDAIGTVRMEAFISPMAFTRVDDYPDEHEELRHYARRRSKELRRRKSRSRQRDSYQSRGTRTTTTDEYGYAGSDDFFRDDPFRGF
ncbi:hypothetical protein MKZ38_005575 [Zalerion maritima]|uniref:Pleckstrin homology domain-containing protein n=1 Tax=Zalerion maritima TaxID=339359 RepID=A0AAD5RK13_9PEZI|nr:hypothetical protein MKZ38_005575 [Zalerion maritima]